MKEFVKSLLLVALTVSAIVMTNSVFGKDQTEIEEPMITYEETDLIQYIRPQNYIFSFGDLFIKLYDEEYENDQENVNIRDQYETVFNSFMTSPSEFGIAETSQEIWDEQVQRKSLLVTYPFDIKLNDLLALYHYNTKLVGDINDIHVTSILFLLNRKDMIYIYDGKNERYYRLNGDESSIWITDLYNLVDDTKSTKDEYRTVEGRYNFLKAGLSKYDIQDPNLLLTPMSENISYPKYNTIKEVNTGVHQDEHLELIAISVFGEDLSFVKKSVYSDNSAIFMYGYGEKVLKINADGSLEYIVKESEANQNEAIAFAAGLAESIEQVSKMGVPSSTIYLSDYYQIESQNAIETIYLFNYTRNGIPFYSPNTRTGDVIEARFLNLDLIKVKKDTRILQQEIYDLHTVESFQSIIIKNRIQIELDYNDDRPDSVVDATDDFQMALQEMSQLELKYYFDEDELIPVWSVVIADTHYIIDITKGTIIEKNKL